MSNNEFKVNRQNFRIVKKDNENLGLISISSTSIEDFPALQIDFFF